MQINGIGNGQIGNSYRNSNRMPNSATGKKEDDEVSKRLEALGVKVELSFQQTPAKEQEVAKEETDSEKIQESFSVVAWFKKIWEAGIAWLKSVWNDGKPSENIDVESESAERETMVADAVGTELLEEAVVAEDEASEGNVAETKMESPVAASFAWAQDAEQLQQGQFVEDLAEETREYAQKERFRTSGVALHTSGTQDAYNRYGQHSKLGVEPSNNMTMRK